MHVSYVVYIQNLKWHLVEQPAYIKLKQDKDKRTLLGPFHLKYGEFLMHHDSNAEVSKQTYTDKDTSLR